MGLRGPKPKGKVKIEWSPDFAYAIGLLVTDGCLSKDGRHIDLTSVDKEQLDNFKKALGISNSIGKKMSHETKIGLRVQFGDVLFYQFLVSIGLTARKSKTIGKIDIPDQLFFDFLRGCLDGDGSFYSYWDPRWKSSFMFYIVLASASEDFIVWIRKELKSRLGVVGHISQDGKQSTQQLKYAKRESLKIIKNVYYSESVLCLTRKRKKIEKALREVDTEI